MMGPTTTKAHQNGVHKKKAIADTIKIETIAKTINPFLIADMYLSRKQSVNSVWKKRIIIVEERFVLAQKLIISRKS